MNPSDEHALAARLLTGLRQEPQDLARWALWSDTRALYGIVCTHGAALLADILDSSGELQRPVLTPEGAPETWLGAVPVVVRFTRGGSALRRMLDAAIGTPWGVFARSTASFDAVHAHIVALHHRCEAQGIPAATLFEPGQWMRLLATLEGDAREELFGPVGQWVVGPNAEGELLPLQR